MKSIYTFLFVIFLIPSLVYSQSNYKPGYVVNLKGDTTRGYLNYREWDKNPKYIAFKKELKQGTPETFTVKNTKSFAVTGLEYYERYVVSVSQDPIDVTVMGSKLDTNYKSDTVFLRVLNKGRYMTLYSYRDDIKFRFYVLESGLMQPQELTYHAYYNSDESSSVRYINRFRTQLQNIAQRNGVTSSELETIISQARYSEDDLIKVATKINGNSQEQMTPESRSAIRWFAGLSITSSNAKAGGVIDAANSNNILPRASFGIDFMPNKNTQQLVLRAGLECSVNHYNFSNSSSSNSYNSNLNQYTLSIVPQFIFNIYNTGNLKWFIDGGISFNLSRYNDYGFTYNFNNISSATIKGYPPLSKAWVSIPIKTGVLLNKKIEVFLGYSPAANLSTDPDASIEITTYQAGINYLFK